LHGFFKVTNSMVESFAYNDKVNGSSQLLLNFLKKTISFNFKL
jgi:hypothetical protein